jgi:hypothetical protein
MTPIHPAHELNREHRAHRIAWKLLGEAKRNPQLPLDLVAKGLAVMDPHLRRAMLPSIGEEECGHSECWTLIVDRMREYADAASYVLTEEDRELLRAHEHATDGMVVKP